MDALTSIKATLASTGYVILRDFCDANDLNKKKAHFLTFCESLGEPITHNHNSGSIIWDIKSNTSQREYKTFSDHNDEALLHTDSAFSAEPEDVFALFVSRSARCGGGISTLMHYDKVLKLIHSHPDGADIERILRSSVFPFAVPDVFKKNVDNTFEYNIGPILYDHFIRYRSDSIRKCVEYKPSLLNHEQLRAIDLLDSFIHDPIHAEQIFLNDNDLIVIDNKRVLHGRTAFDDSERHVLRIRLKT